ncbi:MAG: hypothetical protein KDA79_02215 [Planctomycetaceae bacterium]|nr:hypothetical protein [Planctomycetaceae bacterium]
MPATDSFLRNLRTLHVVFAISALGLFGVTFIMMAKDHSREWRDYQKTTEKIRVARIEQSERLLEEDVQRLERIEAAEKTLQQAESELKDSESRLAELQTEIRELKLKSDELARALKVQNARRDVARANYDLAIRDSLPEARTETLRTGFSSAQAAADTLQLQLQQNDALLTEKKQELSSLTDKRDAARAELTRLESDIDRLHTTLNQIEPESMFSAAKRKIMEWPIIDGFNSHLKIQQDWLPNLKITLGMAETARYDRCRTCHSLIDQIESGNRPAFPHGDSLAGGVSEWVRNKSFPHPYATHPNPDLYLTASSPHPVQKFGCTICHSGQGSATSFTNAAHSPNDPHMAELWHDEHHYASNHFWEYPMHPERFRESGCIKCHHQVEELGVHPKFGSSAPKLYEGYQLLETYGCFGCHEIHGYDAGVAIGPDLRLEPSTAEERERIASDPNMIAGRLRKVGPSLRHIEKKTTPEWVSYWTENPQRFRPSTRMPRFFGLTNQQDPHAIAFEPVELAGISAYLFDRSEEMELDAPKQGYEPDVERGAIEFSRRGCMACHSHKKFPGSKADFGPTLDEVHLKVREGEQGFNWLYSWIREPSRYHARTRMPDLYLDPEGEGDSYADPAADIAAFLLEGGPGTYTSPKFDDQTLDELSRVFLGQLLTREQIDQFLGVPASEGQEAIPASRDFPLPTAAIKGDEIELDPAAGDVSDEEWLNLRLKYVGRRTIAKFGCYGCHDIPGFESARPIGTTLQDWGRKDTSKLAQEHIHEFLHHHGEPDGSSTKELVETAMKKAAADAFDSEEEREDSMRTAYFYEDLMHHGRAGFLWQKLRQPRSYDYHKIETKRYDERLRMPKFPFDERQIEAIATFVLGLVANPPAEEYLYRPDESEVARIEGERLLKKFNCTSCHMVDMPMAKFGITPETQGVFHGAADFVGLTRENLIQWFELNREALLDRSGVPVEIPESVSTILQNTSDILEENADPVQRVPALARYLARMSSAELEGWLDENPGVLLSGRLNGAIYPDAIQKLLELKPPRKALTDQKVLTEYDFGWWLQQLPTVQSQLGELQQELEQVQQQLDGSAQPSEGEAPSREELVKKQRQLTAELTQQKNWAIEVSRARRQLAAGGLSTGEIARLSRSLAEADIEELLEEPEPGDELDLEPGQLQLRQALKDTYRTHQKLLLQTLGNPMMTFRGLPYGLPSEEDLLVDQEYTYDLWETLDVGGRIVLPGSRMLVPAMRMVERTPARGGEFAEWLVESLIETDETIDGNRFLAWQKSPPPLYEEGKKVQTPWLYHFLKNPHQLRYTTVLRMPRFNLDDDEARSLANYFAARDDEAWPYQEIIEREPVYLNEMNRMVHRQFGEEQDYLDQSWKMLNAPLCIKCHSLGGRDFQASDPKKDIRGPNLQYSRDRLRPDWLMVWLYRPAWITPYTSMPAPLPRNQSQFPELFGGSGQMQTRSLRDALMNYNRLMEQHDPTAFNPPAEKPEETATEAPAEEKAEEKKSDQPVEAARPEAAAPEKKAAAEE